MPKATQNQGVPKGRRRGVFGQGGLALRVGLYARVSTHDQQTLPLQLSAMREHAEHRGWTIVLKVEDVGSGVRERPKREELLRAARRRELDVILVWRIDRFARSMKDFVTITMQLDNWNVRLISVTENVDTGDANPFAEFQRGLLALLAQLERKIIVSRVNAGIAEAKRQGKHCGRPKKTFRRDLAREYRARGMSYRAIGEKLGVPFTTIHLALSKPAPVQKPSPK